LLQRFLRYVQIDTQSDETSTSTPSTDVQLDLLRLLRDELVEMGAANVVLTEYGCVLATVPASPGHEDVPTVAFLAHVDTAPAFSGTGVIPLVHTDYDGSPIVLPEDETQVLTGENSPRLQEKRGHDVITASGTTLLGADDKAGVAIAMTLADLLLSDDAPPHGPIRLAFTPDEEIGRGVQHLRLSDLGANVAYTLDGGPVGQIVFETFSADKATVTITGVAAHPGYATGKMVNALHLAAKFAEALPQEKMTPDTTSGRQGFIHLYEMNGNATRAVLKLILRDFELDGLREKGDRVRHTCAQIQSLEPRATVRCTVEPQYRNMRYWLEEDMTPVELAMEAARRAGIEPFTASTRGGTDGSQLTERGLPTPNLFTGMMNIHGPLEWITLQDMALSTKMCLELVQLWAERGTPYTGWQAGET
jgi:tripeptide aminopeptidase